ncbi:MAG: CvpA family protein [Planctomycetota bacterium]
MSFYDIVMLVVLIGAIGFGFWKGLAWQIASVAAIVVSYIVSINFREPVAQYIQASEPWNKIGAMLILFIGCSLLIWVVYAWVTKSMERMELKSFDRQIGALVGGVTGVLLCMAITMFSVSLMGDQAHEAIHDSKLGPHVVRGIQQVHSILPPEVAARFDQYVDHFEAGLGHTLDDAPTGYELFPDRQADGANMPGSTYQGNWPTTQNRNDFNGNGQSTYQVQPVYSSQPTNQTQSGYKTNGTQSGYRYNNQPAPQPTTTQPPEQNVWQPPKLEIKIDSESLLKGLFEKK